MRGTPLVIFFVAARLFGQPATTPQPSAPAPTVEKARIEGRVTSLAGEPLKKATVRLQGTFTAPPTPTNPTPPNSYSSQTDAAGNFVFEEVEPGRYTLSAERTGYVRTNYGARSNSSPAQPLNLSAGQKMTGLAIKMVQQGIISGKVTDEDGDPVARSQVMILQARYLNGKKTLLPAANAMTTADGTFEASGLAAGHYYASAADLQSMIVSSQNELPGHKGPEEAYVTTYYPNSTDVSSAVPIDVATGAEVRGIEIRLQKARVFRIHGQVAKSGTSANVALQLIPQESGNLALLGRGMSLVRPDGSFDFQRVTAGTYIIWSQSVRMNNETGPLVPMYSRQTVTITDSNIDNLQMALVSGGDISGKITIEGRDQQQQQTNDAAKAAASGKPAAPTARPSVFLAAIAPPGVGVPAMTGQSQDDGTFQVKNISPDKYRVQVNGLPDGTYIKSVRYGGQDVTKALLDASSGVSGDLQILLSPEAADCSGTVRDAKGDPMSNLIVHLWEPGSADTPAEATYYRTAVTDAGGTFRFRNLPPGEYRLASWEQADLFTQDPHFRAKFESQATTVKLVAGAHGNSDVTAIPQDVSEVEASKLR